LFGQLILKSYAKDNEINFNKKIGLLSNLLLTIFKKFLVDELVDVPRGKRKCKTKDRIRSFSSDSLLESRRVKRKAQNEDAEPKGEGRGPW
jgi:hypothetical protein